MNKYISLDKEADLIKLQESSADRLYAINSSGMIFTVGPNGKVLKVSRKEFGEIFNLSIEELKEVIRDRGKNLTIQNKDPLVSSNAVVETVRTSVEGADTPGYDTNPVSVAFVNPVSPISPSGNFNKAGKEDTRVTRGEVSSVLAKGPEVVNRKDKDEESNPTALVISKPETDVSNTESTTALKDTKNKSVRKQLRETRQRLEKAEEQIDALTTAVDKIIDIILKKPS